MLVWFLPLFLIFLLIGMPVFFAMLASPGILLWLYTIIESIIQPTVNRINFCTMSLWVEINAIVR